MSLSERVQQLNREIGVSVERALSDLRREVSQRLRANQEEVLRRIDEIVPELPASFLSDDEFDPAVQAAVQAATQVAGAGARRGAFGDLRQALAAVDRGRSQAEILTALLAEGSRFASRTALLLARGNEIRGWGAHGFAGSDGSEATIRGLTFEAPQDGPWGRVLQGGPMRLSASDCAELCSRLEVPLPQEGVLVPLVLRDKTAAAVYADRTDGADLSVEALQLLIYTAALAIETLPFRERSSTATLEPVEGEVEAGEHGDAAAVAAVAPGAEPEPETPAEEPAPAGEPETTSPQTWGAAAEPAAWAEPAEMPAEMELADEPASTGGAYSSYTAVAAPEPAAPLAGESAWEVEAEPEPATPWVAPVDRWVAPANVVAEELPPVVDEPSPATVPAYEAEPVEASSRFTAEVPRVETAEPQSGSQETVLLPRSAFREPEPAREPAPVSPLRPVAPPPPPAALPATADATAGGTSEVRPPSDVQGPGWAFATTRVPVSPNDEALHEEARRLARLLVSEIKLYNEEQVEEGRRNRDVYERLKEDIDRSRQMYEERVEARILKSTDYFYQELVRILAAGDARALGI